MSQSHSSPAPDISSTITVLRILLPFACGYFLSYTYRTVNAVISPDLVTDLGLDAAGLGLLTSVYFLSFGLFQLPLGLLLDRFGPRRTEAVLLLVAASGATLFSVAQSAELLILGRILIGLGVSACLMGSFKAINTWFPAEKLPAMNAWIMTAGGLGALFATTPVQATLQLMSWRSVMGALAGATILVATLLIIVVPREPRIEKNVSFAQLISGLIGIYKSGYFWRIVPLTVATQAAFLSIQGLWAGPWLQDVALLSRAETAQMLFLIAAAMVAGFFLVGQVATVLMRWKIPLAYTMFFSMTMFMICEFTLALNKPSIATAAWLGFGFFGSAGILAFPLLAQRFERSISGRVNTAANVLIFLSAFALQWAFGAIVNLWPQASGYSPTGYQVAFSVCLAVQFICLLWFLPLLRIQSPGRGQIRAAPR